MKLWHLSPTRKVTPAETLIILLGILSINPSDLTAQSVDKPKSSTISSPQFEKSDHRHSKLWIEFIEDFGSRVKAAMRVRGQVEFKLFITMVAK
ncbi:MAG TPA: hypothetical protein EYQ50_24120 [Verrucomicrobiales bacterium]|nr:hypothetical protein [Verrucomicrobiales bacterium]HIL72571.1 hypothetical protein [Verrucomicrobiota bacterium]